MHKPAYYSCRGGGGILLQNDYCPRYQHLRSHSTVRKNSEDEEEWMLSEIRRLRHLRNVGILAHVDAGKTTVTERMLALTGVVRRAGAVDTGSTVTDYLPAERERGITIQSAAVSFSWGWHNAKTGNDYDAVDDVTIHLIDTPGHVDFSVEVNRSVAVLDGAILVVDAAAGVQAQTETVWRALTRPSINNHTNANNTNSKNDCHDHGHEPLPCLAFVNKMDKDGRSFAHAIHSIRRKLSDANPVAIQLPIFIKDGTPPSPNDSLDVASLGEYYIPLSPSSLRPDASIQTMNATASTMDGTFAGVLDLVHMRAVLWPTHTSSLNIEDTIPNVFPLLHDRIPHEPIYPSCPLTKAALDARSDLIAALAEVDDSMEEYFLLEEQPSNAEVREALRRATLKRTLLPVLTGAALKAKGVEPLLDAIADLLPSPLDRIPPALIRQTDNHDDDDDDDDNDRLTNEFTTELDSNSPIPSNVTLGHALHSKLLALAFKVVHLKGRGGSGDGRVVFARVYSGTLKARDEIRVVTPRWSASISDQDNKNAKHHHHHHHHPNSRRKTERVGSLLELSGGKFDNLEDGTCRSGDVCALVGLKHVVTGDTLLLESDFRHSAKKRGKKNSQKRGQQHQEEEDVCLAGVASPRPVLTVRMEAESFEQQKKLSHALSLLAIEDPSLVIEETESTTLVSGLGELHMEIVLDRLAREFGLQVTTGSPAVAYRETITEEVATSGLWNYDRTIGGTRLQAAVDLILEPLLPSNDLGEEVEASSSSPCVGLCDPIITIEPNARQFLGIENMTISEEDLLQVSNNNALDALMSGCAGAFRRGGPVGSHPLVNVRCRILDVSAEGGLSYLQSMPGALRAAISQAIQSILAEKGKDNGICRMLEPTMSVEVTAPTDMVGTVLSDLTARRGIVGDVFMGDNNDGQDGSNLLSSKALIRGEVPLIEILGYATNLRSLTGGEGNFTAEYKGHSPCIPK